MTRQVINYGSVPNDGTGDTLRNAFVKTESNFEELYGYNSNVVNSILVLFTSSSNLTSAVNSINLQLGNTNHSVSNIYTLTNSAFVSANQAGLLANTAGIVANSVALSANNYAGFLANSAAAASLPNTSDAVFNGNLFAANAFSANKGVYSTNNFIGTFTDGIIMDYVNGIGRLSMGALDGLSIYNSGIGTSLLTSISSTGVLSTSNGFYTKGTFNGTFIDGIVADYVTGNGRISVGGADALTFYIGGVGALPTVTISNTANLGIGFTSPAYQLDCNGAANISQPTLLVAGQNVLSSIESVKNRSISSKANPYALTLSDCGKVVAATGTIFVPNTVFYAGNTLYIYNNTATAITITQNTNTILRYAGLANTNRTLSGNGYATLTCIQGIESGANVFVLMGSGIT